MIRVNGIKLHYGEKKELILKRTCNILRIEPKSVISWEIFKESLDVRKKEDIFYIYTVDVNIKNEISILKRIKDKRVSEAIYASYNLPELKTVPKERPVIIGFGPAGIFSALILSRIGLKPIIFERGKDIKSRINDIDKMQKCGILNTSSNIQFGEGGAGTFSDGKLTTRIKNPRCRFVMEEFVKAGAPKEIMYVHNPHIGTDKLRNVIKNIRDEIVSLGGEIHFESTVTDFGLENEKLCFVEINGKHKVKCSNAILAVGHSARDTFEMLKKNKVTMEKKPFAVGVRIEHSQRDINIAQYGSEKAAEYFGPAEYKLTHTAANGRGVYTFCMCPGGYVVPAASEEGMVATNGMSFYDRAGENANSALLVQVWPDDFEGEDVLGGMYFQRRIEKKAFEMGRGNYAAPVQKVGDFILGRKSENEGKVKSTYKPKITLTDLNDLFPDYICDALKDGIKNMGRKVKGFDNPDALMTAPESRSSSPVRILRNAETAESININGLYPAGEGAGYAGGIMSSAVDGIYVAEKIIEKYIKN
ncbi:MAG: hypothetical protein LKJ13_01730 [Clostridia bacterium]|jgi:uncharacterized FAD-dependent dehydrogenase|nr:hypothetical protein [Clostridia bacterium]